MSVNTAAAVFGAGRFGTAKRARVDWSHIERLRAKGHGAQTIANMTGYSMEDVRRVLAGPVPDEVEDHEEAEPVWPFGPCNDVARAVIEHTARKYSVDLSEIAGKHGGDHIGAARNAMYSAVKEFCPAITFIEMGSIFGRDPAAVARGIDAHNRKVLAA